MAPLVYMVAEKPSLALSISNILSDRKCGTRKGFNGACSVHEWNGHFRGQPAKFKMTSVCGHVMSLDFPSKYNNWDRVDPMELFTCATEKKEATPKLKMPAFLASEAKNAEYLVLWLDCDKEGENICFEVMDAVLGAMKRPPHRQVWRAKFSCITDKDIRAAMNALGEPDENQSKSVDARQELDLRIGCAFTRYQTSFFQGKYGDLDSSLISFGPCQTPTLGFCVERHDQITTFKPETYWVLQVKAETTSEGNLPSRVLSLEWERVRSFDRDIANMFLNLTKQQTVAKVSHVGTKEKAKDRPIALNTVELMRVASSYLGMGPQYAMQIAEKLYIQGYISYPRTESTQYSENFDLKEVLMQQKNHCDWGGYVKDLLTKGINRPRKGHDAGDHPPITPMRCAVRNEFESNDSFKLYDYIVRHFIGTVSYNCKYSSTIIHFKVGEEKFTFSGKKLLEPGFTSVMPWQALTEGESVPSLMSGVTLDIKESKLEERQTCPPDYLSEADLITLMEKHGIGTDASIPVHINNICQRNYVTITSSGRRLIPTTLGIVLVHGYLAIDPDLVHPQMRSAVEKQLDLISQGKADYRSVLRHTLEVFKHKFTYFVKSIEGMNQLFEVSFSSLAESGRRFSRCGKCRRYMLYIQAKPSRLYCDRCDEALSLPQNGNIRVRTEFKCPLDDFEILYFTAGVKGKSYIFCPYCYNNPPFREMTKKGATSGCNSCTHPTCAHSQNTLGVSNCVECENGVLVLDVASMPKWKLGCNRCDIIVRLFEDANKVTVLNETCCSTCEAQLMKVEYKAGKSKLADDKLSSEGCIFCDQELSQLVEKQHAAVFMKRRNVAGGRGRGGNRRGGRGGRGGGRGRKVPKDKMSKLAAYFV